MYRWLCLKTGTGKSTLIKFIIQALDINPEEDVCYIAFTGKAANVLTQKGCPNAITAHKLLYNAKQLPSGKYKFTPRKKLEHNYKIIVVDEVSMLPKQMWDLLLSHGVYILACGDPGQLPPIDPQTNNHILDKPHIFLDEVMRQAQDSEIIRLSMWIRENKSLNSFPCSKEQVQLFNLNEISIGMFNWADQILCATNEKRIAINDIVRKSKGFGEEPELGDKIISLKNHWSVSSSSGGLALTNGSIGTIQKITKQQMFLPIHIYDRSVPVLNTDISLEDNNEDGFNDILIDYKCLTTGTPTLTPHQIFLMKKREIMPPYDFAYAYAITTHKAQGSEWDKVLVFEEKFPFNPEDHKRWLYTACTRASKKLVIIKK